MTQSLFAIGLGVGTKNQKGEWLDVFYPRPLLNPDAAIVAAIAEAGSKIGANAAIELSNNELQTLIKTLRSAGATEQADIAEALLDSTRPMVLTVLATDEAPKSVAEAYLKLHLLSHRLVKPHGIVLAGIFGVLPNVAWTNEGAIDLSELPQRQFRARLRGELLEVMSVDKFPKMTNYVVPSGVRIAHTARVRLGAYLGEGTTIMHEGFVNFNAGTEGPGMVEGRISAGVFVGAGSDLGGGCSTMGTLSGGNNIIISLGKGCLIGANAGVGIPLGDRCTIEAGLYVTAGSVASVLDDKGQLVRKVKARELSGKDDLLFRRNSQNGALEVLTNKSAIELNAELHAHN
ncbi:MAG: 2,3,4,5-tetrahydropyridine-2,6-dicarboxylate N-succinyltransferase [Verrucomicrobiaceae bacterium]|nr:2,3,4,5-tetrahydropyridine-2,6-dicarboxylate N-succinyltransferase [Verrucomicrobiaceae bacterium]